MTALTDVPVRECACCGETLVRKRYPSGNIEPPRDFRERRFCDRSCMGRHNAGNLPQSKPKPAPRFVFSRVYEEALARGVDLLELNDAAWEA